MSKLGKNGNWRDANAGPDESAFRFPWRALGAQPRAAHSHRRCQPEDGEAGSMLISVVVPTCGRPALLDRCLAALANQRFDPARYEIIVVDDAPDEEVRSLVLDWTVHTLGRGPIIGYIASRGPHGPAAARNRGWRAGSGEIVAFTDDDTEPDRDWLRQGYGALCDGGDAAWGRIVVPIGALPTDYELDARNLERAQFATANCFCRRAVLEELKGFDERFRLAWREDSDFYFRLLGRAARVAHVPEAVVVHPVRPAPWGVSLVQQKKIAYDALLYKKHPRLYRERIRARARWDYYLIVAALAAAPLAAALGAPALAGMAAALWLGLTGALCARRLRCTSKAPRHVAEMIVTSALIPPLAVFWRLVGAIRFRAPLL